MGMTRSRFLTLRRVLGGARSITDDPPPANLEYLRLMYASTRDWYTAAETKAQLLLAVNGVFVTLLFGLLFGNADGVHAGSRTFGLDTWIFAGVSVLALLVAVSCAVLSLWSLHGRAGRDFARLRIDPAAPDSYRPEVLWYFGHLARLPRDAAEAKLRESNRQDETEALIYHVIDLSRKVLRKHRWVNAGWAFYCACTVRSCGSWDELLRAQQAPGYKRRPGPRRGDRRAALPQRDVRHPSSSRADRGASDLRVQAERHPAAAPSAGRHWLATTALAPLRPRLTRTGGRRNCRTALNAAMTVRSDDSSPDVACHGSGSAGAARVLFGT
jgi:Family of unknown function (DUF5706)